MINEWSKETGRGTGWWWWNKRRKRQANPFNQIFSTFYAPSVWTYVTFKVPRFERGIVLLGWMCLSVTHTHTHELLPFHSTFHRQVKSNQWTGLFGDDSPIFIGEMYLKRVLICKTWWDLYPYKKIYKCYLTEQFKKLKS